jgi:PleD family two-component response regulator
MRAGTTDWLAAVAPSSVCRERATFGRARARACESPEASVGARLGHDVTEALGATTSRRIVLVDDDGVCLAMLSSRLRKRGFDVCAYGDPREAMRQLPIDLPAAVITDLKMPHMSGLDVVQEVRHQLGANAPPTRSRCSRRRSGWARPTTSSSP